MPPDLAEARACIGFALQRASRSVTRHYDAVLRPVGLRSTQFNLLVLLDATGAITTTILARQMAVERTTLSRNLVVLTNKGWVRSEPGEDLRVRRLSLTPQGRRAAVKALSAWHKAQATLAKSLGSGPLGELINRLVELDSIPPKLPHKGWVAD